MVVDRTGKVSVRIGRIEMTRLGWALVISLVAHLFLWGGYAAAKHYHLLSLLRLPNWLDHLVSVPPPQPPQQQASHEPYMFIDVRDYQSVPEPPKDAIRYSDRNAIATNPDEPKDKNEPKVEGEKNEQQSLEDANRRNKFDQLMPDPPKPEPETQPEAKPNPGTLKIAKAETQPPQERKRPRTIREALLQKAQTPGRKTQRDGGASHRGHLSYDVKVTGFGAYDRLFIDAVTTRWYDLLDNLSYDNYQQGKVVVQFTLNYKGEISNVRIADNTVSDMLSLMCEKAIRDPAPFGEWTKEMRLAVGDDTRRITFTFFYN